MTIDIKHKKYNKSDGSFKRKKKKKTSLIASICAYNLQSQNYLQMVECS